MISAESLVLTREGYKPAREIREKDVLLTHKATWEEVRSTCVRGYAETVVCLTRSETDAPIRASVDQLFLVKSINAHTGLLSKVVSWVPACSIALGRHALCTPLNREETSISINVMVGGLERRSDNIDWFMVGYYVGMDGRSVALEFVPPGWSILSEFTLSQEVVHSGRTCIPEWMQSMPTTDIESFLRGFEAASHGRFTPIGGITFALQRLYAKTGLFAKFESRDSRCRFVIDDRTQVLSDEEYTFSPVTHITEERSHAVMVELVVGEANSFVADNVVCFGK